MDKNTERIYDARPDGKFGRTLQEVLTSRSLTDRAVVASKKTSIPRLLSYLAWDESNDVVVEAAKNPRTPRHILTLLSLHDSVMVRRGLASNTATP